jgi:hypothetical protein
MKRELKTRNRKERNKGNEMEARSIGRSKSSHFITLYNYCYKALY